ncbi:MAG: hypothetical protein K6G76_12460 [Lachnospiraceae bacterium]|nr:hypothetical protein [Lachnospiraceae bacterium]
MNKAIRVILDILIVVASLAFLIFLVVVTNSIKYARSQKEEDPVENTMSSFEYELEHKSYGEIVDDYHSKRLGDFEAPEGMEDLYRVADYAHTAFMSRVYEAKGDAEKIASNATKLKEQREQLGSYQYAADEVDEIIKSAP